MTVDLKASKLLCFGWTRHLKDAQKGGVMSLSILEDHRLRPMYCTQEIVRLLKPLRYQRFYTVGASKDCFDLFLQE